MFLTPLCLNREAVNINVIVFSLTSLGLEPISTTLVNQGRHGRDSMVVVFTIPLQSVTITTKVVSLNPAHDEVYSINLYVIKFVNDLRQVGGFLWVLWFPLP